MIFIFLALASQNGLLSRKLHLYLFLLNVFKALDFVFFVHFGLPAIELGGILETHGHLVKTNLFIPFLFVNQVLLALQGSHIELHISLLLLEVGHRPRLVALKSQLSHDGLLDLFLDFVEFLNRGSCLRRQRETLLWVGFVLVADDVDRGLSALSLVRLNLLQRLLVHAFGHWSGLDLTLDLLGRRDHFRLRLCQVEWLELRAFRLFFLFGAAFRKQL